LSIFQKDCPRCAASNSVTAVQCTCGYYFELDNVTDRETATEVVAQDERLYEEYLAARLSQAEEEYRAAREAQANDPDDTYKAVQTLLAEQALHAARAELEAQRNNVNIMKHETRQTSRVRIEGPQNKTKPTPISTTGATHQPAGPPKPVRAIRSVRPPPFRSGPKSMPMKSEPASKPDENFRVAQAAKARQALLKAKPALDKSMDLSQPSRRLNSPIRSMAEVRSPQSVTARKVPLPPKKPVDSKECPNCTANLAFRVMRCRCGYGFPVGGPDLPTLPLDTSERAILLAETRFGRIIKRG
jgi:hypothetical protein